MNRTQIYLTPDQAEGVARVANETGRNQSEVIREALDLYLKRTGTQDRLRRPCGVPARVLAEERRPGPPTRMPPAPTRSTR